MVDCVYGACDGVVGCVGVNDAAARRAGGESLELGRAGQARPAARRGKTMGRAPDFLEQRATAFKRAW